MSELLEIRDEATGALFGHLELAAPVHGQMLSILGEPEPEDGWSFASPPLRSARDILTVPLVWKTVDVDRYLLGGGWRALAPEIPPHAEREAVIERDCIRFRWLCGAVSWEGLVKLFRLTNFVPVNGI